MAVVIATALFVANHGPGSLGTTSRRTQHHTAQPFRPRAVATLPPTHVPAGPATEALTLLAYDAPPVAPDAGAAPADASVVVAPVTPRPEGRLASAAPGVIHTIQAAQSAAAPLAGPVVGAVAPADPQEGADPGTGSGGSPAADDCPLLTPVKALVGAG